MKIKTVITVIGALLFVVSCASQPVDLGAYNPDNLSEEDLVTLFIQEQVKVQQIDNEKVNWSVGDQQMMIKIPSGLHVFQVSYSNSYGRPIAVMAEFKQGNAYLLSTTQENVRTVPMGNGQTARISQISFHIYLYNEKTEGAEISLDINKLRGNDSSMLSAYIKYVLNPGMDGTENTVKMENDTHILMFKPDMVYSLTDKKTGKTSEGRNGFSMNIAMTEGEEYLLETDISKMSRQQFLESKYQESAQIVLIPVNCNEKEVTYRYKKPIELQGKEITFAITVIPR